MLARDIDLFRQAIGAEKMSIAGVSYGTGVAAVYASVFPANVDRLVINGNMFPVPDVREFTQSNGATLQQAVSHLLQNCENQPSCVRKNPFAAFESVMAAIRSETGLLSPVSNQGVQLRLSPGMLGGFLQGFLADGSGANWNASLQVIAVLYQGTAEQKLDQVGFLMDLFCTFRGVPTWRNYSACIGSGQLAEGAPDAFIEQSAVIGADLAGRYDLESVMMVYTEARERLDTLSLSSFVGILAPLFSWQATPMPPAPIGNALVAPLVVGNLYDPSTGYRWSQAMASAFPNSHMVTWQGVGHTLRVSAFDVPATTACLKLIANYMKDRELPLNGHVCHQLGVVPVPTAVYPLPLAFMSANRE